MFHELFRTKERKVIGVILGVVLVISLIIAFFGSSDNNQRLEKAVMAENYLNAGSYEEAVKAYQAALSEKGSDEELLSIGLADAYVGLKEYDSALEVLQSCYQKKATEQIKKKIEEVTAAETDEEFLQSISRGDVYFSNKEYDKAIAVYEEAKQIKRKDILPYKKIIQAYINQEQYAKAEKEAAEGIKVTGNDELYTLLASIEHYLLKDEYDEIIAQAKEYIYQENYEDGINAYRDAIKLLPEEKEGYLSLGQLYIDQEDYDSAVALLKEGTLKVKDADLKELLELATEKQQVEEEKISFLSELRDALAKKDIAKVFSITGSDFYQTEILQEVPVYYGVTSEDESRIGDSLVIYDETHMYYGNLNNGMKQGTGIYLSLISNDVGDCYYYYEGEWSNDIPGGKGKIIDTELKRNSSGEVHEYMTETEGTFFHALEDGAMKKIFYKDGKEMQWIKYRASNGKPLAMGSVANVSSTTPAKEPYVIGELYHGEDKTGESYTVEPGTVWGVKPFINK